MLTSTLSCQRNDFRMGDVNGHFVGNVFNMTDQMQFSVSNLSPNLAIVLTMIAQDKQFRPVSGILRVPW